MQVLYVSVYEAAICQPKHLLDSYIRWQDDGALPRNYIRLAVFQCPDRGNFLDQQKLGLFQTVQAEQQLEENADDRVDLFLQLFEKPTGLRGPQHKPLT